MTSTPDSSSHAGAEVESTRSGLTPSSTNSLTRCEPRNPVPPVTSVTGLALRATAVVFDAAAFFVFDAAFLGGVFLVVAIRVLITGERSASRRSRRQHKAR